MSSQIPKRTKNIKDLLPQEEINLKCMMLITIVITLRVI